MSNFSILIPARGGSKRIPNKNIIEVFNRPLISFVIEQAKKITDKVYVSTDCDHIATVASSLGARIIERPRSLATDTSDVRHTIKHFLECVHTEILVLMQATSPSVKYEYVLEGLEKIKHKDSVISVCEVRDFLWSQDGYPVNYKIGAKPRTQDMIPYYRENGAFYITRSQSFLENFDLTSGDVGFVKMPKNLSTDIDTKEDLELFKRMINNDR